MVSTVYRTMPCSRFEPRPSPRLVLDSLFPSSFGCIYSPHSPFLLQPRLRSLPSPLHQCISVLVYFSTIALHRLITLSCPSPVPLGVSFSHAFPTCTFRTGGLCICIYSLCFQSRDFVVLVSSRLSWLRRASWHTDSGRQQRVT